VSKRKINRRPHPLRNYWLFGGAFIIAAAGVLYLVWANTRPEPEAFVPGSPGEPLRLPTPAGRARGTTFDVPGHVGERAPAFTAVGVDGEPYTMTPGDGRPKVLIFYMGFR